MGVSYERQVDMGYYGYGYGGHGNDGDYDALNESHDPPPNAIYLEGPLQAESKRGAIGREWWGQQWVKAMERLGLSARMERGKRYARNGSVQFMEIGHGETYAVVSGSHGRSYHTRVILRPLTDEQWQKALEALASQAIFAAKLLADEMPGDIEAIFQDVGLSLFPQTTRDIDFDCSCPDWGDPCKHSAAVYYLLAEQLDSDPFVLFHMRGRSREQVLSALRLHRGGEDEVMGDEADAQSEIPQDTTPALHEDLNGFWSGSAVQVVRAMPTRGDKAFALRQLGTAPGGVQSELSRLYADITNEASLWLGLEGDEG